MSTTAVGGSWFGDDFRERMAEFAKAVEPMQRISVDFARHVQPMLEAQRRISALVSDLDLPLDNIRRVLEVAVEQAALPSIELPEALVRDMHMTPERQALIRQFAEIAVAHRGVSRNLTEPLRNLLKGAFEGIDPESLSAEEVAPEPLAHLYQDVAWYTHMLIIAVWLMLVGMIIASKATGADRAIVEMLEQIDRSTGWLQAAYTFAMLSESRPSRDDS